MNRENVETRGERKNEGKALKIKKSIKQSFRKYFQKLFDFVLIVWAFSMVFIPLSEKRRINDTHLWTHKIKP